MMQMMQTVSRSFSVETEVFTNIKKTCILKLYYMTLHEDEVERFGTVLQKFHTQIVHNINL